VDVTAPVLSCPAAQQFCVTAGPNYTIPQATATDNCGGAVTLSYAISGATTGSGSGGNASGSYNAGLSTITGQRQMLVVILQHAVLMLQ
jgi:hypothetical protein